MCILPNRELKVTACIHVCVCVCVCAHECMRKRDVPVQNTINKS